MRCHHQIDPLGNNALATLLPVDGTSHFCGIDACVAGWWFNTYDAACKHGIVIPDYLSGENHQEVSSHKS